MPNDHGAQADLARSLRRLDARIRRWSNARWAIRGADGRIRAEAAHELVVTLAELGRAAGNGAPPDPPPVIALHALADQLTVVGQELLGAPRAAAYAEQATAAVQTFLSTL